MSYVKDFSSETHHGSTRAEWVADSASRTSGERYAVIIPRSNKCTQRQSVRLALSATHSARVDPWCVSEESFTLRHESSFPLLILWPGR